jgi:probable phosphoglycerate mutase
LRTRQTAQAIAAPHGLAVSVDPGLREAETYVPRGKALRDVVDATALAEMQRRFRLERRWDAFGQYRESSAALRKRVNEAVEAIIARHEGGRVAVVTHNPIVSVYLACVLKSEYDMPFYSRLTGVSVVFAEGEQRSVRAVNSAAHFRAL